MSSTIVMIFDTFEDVEKYLNTIPKFQSSGAEAANFDLSRFEQFCQSIGKPQEQFPAVHVAGTNGKGSTCHMLDQIYRQAGYRVGLYTSPHIVDFNERFQLNGKPISDEALITFFQRFADRIEEYKLTYFEISTAIAFWWFAESGIDIAILEVGLGGRLDATNIIDPLVSVITSIGTDHSDILGETIEEIAAEKAGIIKQGRPVVVGDLPDAAVPIVNEIARDRQAPLVSIEELHPQMVAPVRYQLQVESELIEVRSPLLNPIQAQNIAIAWRVMEVLKDQFSVEKTVFLQAMQQMELGPARFEKLAPSQEWYFDGAHNLEAVRALKQSVQMIGTLSDATLVLCLMRDKVNPEVMKEFSEFKNIYYYSLGLERAANYNDIVQWLPDANPFPALNDHQSFRNDLNSELVIFAGSFYFYNTVRDWVSSIA